MRRLIAATAALVLTGVAALWLLWPARQAEPLAISVAAQAPGTVVMAQGHWVARQPDGEFRVFRNLASPYKNRIVHWLEAENQFEEPVSSARYTIDGTGIFGPAGRLWQVKSRLEGETLLVWPDEVLSGGVEGSSWWDALVQRLLKRTATPQAPARVP